MLDDNHPMFDTNSKKNVPVNLVSIIPTNSRGRQSLFCGNPFREACGAALRWERILLEAGNSAEGTISARLECT